MARDINKFLIKITDEPTWESMLEVSESKVVLLDIHQDWCGHCEAIQPTILRVLLDYDDAEDRFAYYSSNLTKNMETLKAFFPSDSNINLEKHGCLPLFLIIRVCFFFSYYFHFSTSILLNYFFSFLI